MDGSEWTKSMVHGPYINRDMFIEFTIESINYKDHSGMIIGVTDDLKKEYSNIIG